MTELSPSLLELKAELGRAIREDHQRRQRRRKTVRTSALSLGAFAVMSGSALAAGDALGVIDLGGGSSAAPVSSFPVGTARPAPSSPRPPARAPPRRTPTT